MKMVGIMKNQSSLVPFVSVGIFFLVWFAYLVVKMEAVRMTYEFVRVQHLEKLAKDDHAHLEATYSRLTRPERIDKIATEKLALVRAQKRQIIMMASRGGVAFSR